MHWIMSLTGHSTNSIMITQHVPLTLTLHQKRWGYHSPLKHIVSTLSLSHTHTCVLTYRHTHARMRTHTHTHTWPALQRVSPLLRTRPLQECLRWWQTAASTHWWGRRKGSDGRPVVGEGKGSTLKDSGELIIHFSVDSFVHFNTIGQSANSEWWMANCTEHQIMLYSNQARDKCNCKFHARAYSVRSPV